MIKLYTPLHNAYILFKKQFLSGGLLLFSALLMGTYADAQCIPAPVVNAVTNQVVCNKTATAVINFTGTATSYNWTNTNASIGLAASGTGNISSFTALNPGGVPVTATISVTPVTGACTGTPINFTITVNPSPAVAVTPIVSCGGAPGGTGPCNPLTATGADSYVWSPISGLYTDCTSFIPYTGGSVATVYASPNMPVVYAVTGLAAATGCYNSATATVNYTPAAPVVTPSSVFMCLGDAPVKVKLTTAPITNQFCSGPVNIPVPDNNAAGGSSNIIVAGIPAPSVITGISVAINMPHTRIGDMVFVLKAPNGQIINLDYRLTATGGNGVSTGFVNSVISSNGTSALSAGASPYTGVFKADAQIAPAGGFGAAGATGFTPTTTSWSSLMAASINGNWTLGFYDGLTGEVGTLSSWCINLSYTLGTFGVSVPGIWSPNPGLFYDPAATVPYTGNAMDSLYVKPSPTGVYTYQVTTQGVPAPPVSFSNFAAISIPVGGAAFAYPSNVTVSGLPATGATVKSIVLNGFNHTRSEDVDIVLQSPTGQNMILMSDVGGANAANATYTFTDAGAAMSTTSANPTGTYKPTNNGTPDNFPAPGPGSLAQPAPSIAAFTGNFNGTWKLFVLDDDGSSDLGAIANGYTINFDPGYPPCTSPPQTLVVTVGLPTVITTQPVNQNVCLGNDAQFSVVATGSGLTYQWQVSTNGGATFSNLINGGGYNGVNTATLTITAPPLSMSGYRYKVIINGSAACGAAASGNALLTVNPLPLVSIYAHPYTKLLPGLTTTISSFVVPNAAATYTWLHDGLVVPGATADSIVVDFDNIGLYQLRVTDINGCTNVSDTMSIRDSLHGKMLFVYPNPSSGRFQVRLYNEPNTVSPRTLTVYDNMGNKVISRSYTQANSYQRIDVDVRKYGKGIYWVEVTDVNGKRLGLSRVLIQ